MKLTFHANQILYVKNIGYARVNADTNKQFQLTVSKPISNDLLNNENETAQNLPKSISQLEQ